MRVVWIATCLAITLLAGQAIASEQEQKKEVAEDKAEVLEHKAAEKGADVPVPRSEAITTSEVQAVDPAGASPLDDAITCMARSIYWEAKGKSSADMEAVAQTWQSTKNDYLTMLGSINYDTRDQYINDAA